MNIIENPVIKHFKKFPRYEPQHLDASALSELKKCAQKFFFRYILGLVPRGESEIYFDWGSAYHKFREVIEVEYKKNPNPENLRLYIAVGMQAALKIWNNKRGLPGTKYEFMTPERLAETLAYAGNCWIQEKKEKRVVVVATEQPFNVTLENGTVRTGRFDQIILKDNRLWGRDFKTSIIDSDGYERYTYPNDQFAGYTFAEHILNGGDPALDSLKVRGQYVEVMHNAKGTKKDPKIGPKIYTKIVEYTPQALRRWSDEQAYWEAARVAMRENDLYPMTESHCAWCVFHRVCRLPTESSQEYELRTKYVVKLWDNTKEVD